MIKETKKQLKQRLALSHKPVPVAVDRRTGEPKMGEMMARLHADILAGRKIPESAEKYRKTLMGMTQPESLQYMVSTGEVPDVRTHVPSGYCSHKTLIGRLMGSKAAWPTK